MLPKFLIFKIATALFLYSNFASALTTGTGFYIHSSGVLVTNYHVISGAKKISIRSNNGDINQAIVLRVDRANDLALLKSSKSPVKPIFVASSTSVQKGDEVFTIGYPQVQLQGLDSKITTGIISSLGGFKGEPNSYQISVPIQPGNSGGPLINNSGLVIGVVVSKLSPAATINDGIIPENVNYAIKSNYLLELMNAESIQAPKQIDHPKQNQKLPAIVRKIDESIVMVISDLSDEGGSKVNNNKPKEDYLAKTIPDAADGAWRDFKFDIYSWTIDTKFISRRSNVLIYRQKGNPSDRWQGVRYFEVNCSTLQAIEFQKVDFDLNGRSGKVINSTTEVLSELFNNLRADLHRHLCSHF